MGHYFHVMRWKTVSESGNNRGFPPKWAVFSIAGNLCGKLLPFLAEIILKIIRGWLKFVWICIVLVTLTFLFCVVLAME